MKREFKELLKNKLEVMLGNEFENFNISIRKITKNNNITMNAITISHKDGVAAPTIYIDKFYEEYNDGRNISEICEDIIQIYKNGIENFNIPFDTDEMYDYKVVKPMISYRLINYEMNKKMLEEVPHFAFLDLAVVFYIHLENKKTGHASVLIQNNLFKYWNVTVDELKRDAIDNTQKNYPAKIRKMDDIISDMIMEDISSYNEKYISDSNEINDSEDFYQSKANLESIIKEELDALNRDDINMYVLTNNIKFFGATCITYPGILKRFAEKINDDVCIIPSSIHEVILVPASDVVKENMNNIICEVNEAEVDPMDVLSDHIYLYKYADNEIVY